MKRLYIKTHGCQMNEYDSTKMAEVLHHSHGLTLTTDLEEADVILLNTCSIREKAQEKVFSELGRWRKFKQNRPHVVIGVGGCVASQEGQGIVERAPFVDLVFGPQTLHRLPQLLNQCLTTKKAAVDISFPEIEKFDSLPEPHANGPTALVSIMEGCSKYCSFCVVPYTRGEEISRPFDDVIAEIVSLAEQGVKEVTLLGQNVNDYRGLMHDGKIADLALLIHYISALDSIERIRFTTSHPSAFSKNLIQAYAEEPKLANHLHLPVQSGSDRILAAMKRGYTALEFKSKIRQLRQVRPNISISSDFIVGFPGETEADFQATLNLIAEIGFDHSYSFIYSKRPGTPAAQLADDTPIEVKKQRLAILQARINQQAQKISQEMVGTDQWILVTGLSKNSSLIASGEQADNSQSQTPPVTPKVQLSGRTENNRVVNFYGPPQIVGQMIKIKILEALPNSLRGQEIG